LALGAGRRSFGAIFFWRGGCCVCAGCYLLLGLLPAAWHWAVQGCGPRSGSGLRACLLAP
jgi:hypothetical protein